MKKNLMEIFIIQNKNRHTAKNTQRNTQPKLKNILQKNRQNLNRKNTLQKQKQNKNRKTHCKYTKT